jgi:hypothetical protein
MSTPFEFPETFLRRGLVVLVLQVNQVQAAAGTVEGLRGSDEAAAVADASDHSNPRCGGGRVSRC